MSKIGTLSAGLKVLGSLRSFNHYSKDIAAARNSGGDPAEQEALANSTYKWASRVLEIFDVDLHVTGTENIPEKDGFVVISNHQGYADIVALLVAFRGHQLGFVAKEELRKVPYIGKWIQNIHGVFLKRGNPREAIASMKEGVAQVKRGFNMVIFPEGTRSKGPVTAPFKAGSFKLATMAKAKIVPVTINGTYHIYEETGSAHKGVDVYVAIHPAVDTASLDRKAIRQLETQVRDTVISGLPEEEQKLALPQE
ncbi:MAG: lysophospholipid acyltransferase family protein [Eubacteriales bacterium]|nr:lysophospholipid acyltransferase family protein [Eubacteriales bacterium]